MSIAAACVLVVGLLFSFVLMTVPLKRLEAALCSQWWSKCSWKHWVGGWGGINVIEALRSLVYFNGPAALWMWNLLTVHKSISWKIKKRHLVKEGPTVDAWIQTPGCWLSRQRHWKHSIKPTALQLSLSAICLLSFETQLCDHWQTPAPNTAIFPSLPPDGSIENRCTATVCLLLRAVVVMELLMIIKHLLWK